MAKALNKEAINIKDRIISYLLFGLSFFMGSCLVMYGMVLLMILSKNISRGKIRANLAFVDFLALIIFHIVLRIRPITATLTDMIDIAFMYSSLV